MPQLDIIGQTYTTRSPSEDCQTCVNWYPEAGGVQSKYKAVLYPTPGLTTFCTLDGTVVRAMTEFDGFLYAVCDRKFYKISQDGTATLKGTLNAVQPIFPPCIVSNGLQICVVDNGYGYVYSISGDTFTEITNAYFTAAAPNYITFQDGYGIFNQPGTPQWWLTLPNDFSVVQALDLATASTTNEDIAAIVSCRQQLYIFTSVGVEIWFNSGAADFPFERKNTSYITQGTAAPFSIVTLDNTIFYLTRSEQGSGFVVKIEGDSNPAVVSTPAINQMIQKIDTISDAIGFSYQDNGHLFYVLTFPTGDQTFVYDLSQDAWHERKSTLVNDPGSGTRQGRFRGNCFAFLGNNRLVGDFQNGKIYVQDSDVYTENGNLIYRERTTGHLWDDLKRLTLRSITLDFQMGVGNVTGSYTDPKINLYISKDGGYTYGNSHIASLGGQGQYKKRVRFNRLGMSRDFVGKITCSDPVNVVLLGASAEVEQADS